MSSRSSSGVVVGPKRSTTEPSRPIRNFVKFHLIAPPIMPFFSSLSHL